MDLDNPEACYVAVLDALGLVVLPYACMVSWVLHVESTTAQSPTCRLLMNQGARALDMNSLMHVLKKLKMARADHLVQLSMLRPMNTVSWPGPTCM